jgi:hypothetical protein
MCFSQSCEKRLKRRVAHINQSYMGDKQDPTQCSEAHIVRGPIWWLQIPGGIQVI